MVNCQLVPSERDLWLCDNLYTNNPDLVCLTGPCRNVERPERRPTGLTSMSRCQAIVSRIARVGIAAKYCHFWWPARLYTNNRYRVSLTGTWLVDAWLSIILHIHMRGRRLKGDVGLRRVVTFVCSSLLHCCDIWYSRMRGSRAVLYQLTVKR